MTIRKPVVSQAAWVLASIASTSALGQTAPEVSAEAVEVEEIVVTGSRIARSDFSSTSPIVTFGEEAIAQSGTVNIEQAMNQLPQFVQGQTSSTVGAVALAGRASLNLRGLGETRNLVLLDGRRLPLSNANAVVDVNLIPQFILERRRDDHRRRFRGLRFRRDVGRRQLQEHHRLRRACSSMCVRA